MTDGFQRFNKTWATNGTVIAATDSQANQGWAYIGETPPSVEQFNWVQQNLDVKDNWLYAQIANVITAANATVTESAITGLRDALLTYWTQAGTGIGQQAGHNIKIGWTGAGKLTATVDTTDLGPLALESWVTTAISTISAGGSSNYNDLLARINAEINNRTNGDNTLNASIIAVNNDRLSAESRLRSDLDSEFSNRANGDASLVAQISAEATTRFQQDTIINNSLASFEQQFQSFDNRYAFPGGLWLEFFDVSIPAGQTQAVINLPVSLTVWWAVALDVNAGCFPYAIARLNPSQMRVFAPQYVVSGPSANITRGDAGMMIIVVGKN